MRKITEQATRAFRYNEKFKKANTEVHAGGSMTELYLHNNLIATKQMTHGTSRTHTFKITCAGWMTPTTKERLRGLDGVHIQTKKGITYLNGSAWDGSPTKMLDNGEWEYCKTMY